jgi:hypothetical protein
VVQQGDQATAGEDRPFLAARAGLRGTTVAARRGVAAGLKTGK